MLFSIQIDNVEAYRSKTPSSILYLVSSLNQNPPSWVKPNWYFQDVTVTFK